uniref:Uncharacterized protein n=1 Tax=Strongyloides venezuelensis TaxID=75913 RepID=A0A0K0ETV5_STRVS
MTWKVLLLEKDLPINFTIQFITISLKLLDRYKLTSFMITIVSFIQPLKKNINTKQGEIYSNNGNFRPFLFETNR